MKSKWLTLFLFFIFNSCSTSDTLNHTYTEVMKEINEYSKVLETEKGIICRGYGLHYAGQDNKYDGKIHVIDLAYSIDKHTKYDEGRSMFYSIVDGLLNKINSNSHLKDHFFHYPVTYNDLFISLSFDYTITGRLKKDEIDQITIFENKIIYQIIDEEPSYNMSQKRRTSNSYTSRDASLKTRAIVKELPEV